MEYHKNVHTPNSTVFEFNTITETVPFIKQTSSHQTRCQLKQKTRNRNGTSFWYVLIRSSIEESNKIEGNGEDKRSQKICGPRQRRNHCGIGRNMMKDLSLPLKHCRAANFRTESDSINRID